MKNIDSNKIFLSKEQIDCVTDYLKEYVSDISESGFHNYLLLIGRFFRVGFTNSLKSSYSGNDYPKDLNPIGIIPKNIHDKQRRNEILSAIDRYKKADLDIPNEWLKELLTLQD